METTNINIDALLSSKEFTNIVNQLANKFGVAYNSELKDDVRQVCAMKAWEALATYDPAKVGNNFWGYAYPRMYEYAKREVYEQRNTVHIPMNRTSEWGASDYEKTSHSYEALTWEDGHDRFAGESNNAIIAMDLQAALNSLDETSRYIVEVYTEMKSSKTGKHDFASIAEKLKLPTHVVRRKFAQAKETLATYLA